MPSGARCGSGRTCSGLHDNIPNGSTAPGNVLPPLALPMRVSTTDAGSATSGSTCGAALSNALSAAAQTAAPAIRLTDMATDYRIADDGAASDGSVSGYDSGRATTRPSNR